MQQSQRPSAPPSTRLSPLPPEPADFYNDFATPVDIPMDTNKVAVAIHVTRWMLSTLSLVT
jgi:hypothetical protein